MCQPSHASDDSSSAQWAQHWMGDLNCPLCGSAYDADQLHPIRKDMDRWTLSVQCYCCGTGSLITTPAFMAAEITSATHEHEKLAPFSADDVLEWHRLLLHFEGDWVHLWLMLRYMS
jgi:hypothetical protein